MQIPAQRAFHRFVFLLGAIAIAQSPLMLRASKLGQIYHILVAGGGLMMVGGAAHEIRQEPSRRFWHAFANGRMKRTRQPMLAPIAGHADPTSITTTGNKIPVIYNAPTKAEALRILGIWRQCQIQARLDEQAQQWARESPAQPQQLQPSRSSAVHLKQPPVKQPQEVSSRIL